jgi:hypothetical protein
MSIDAFLQELFPSSAGAADPRADAVSRLAGGLRDRADFYDNPDIGIMDKDRRRAGEDASASGDYAPTPSGMTYRPWDPRGGDDDAALPPNSTLNSGAAPSNLPIVNPPLPRPRPPEAGPGASMMPPGGVVPPTAAGGGNDPMFSRLAGLSRPGGGAGAGKDDGPNGIMGRLLGMDASREKRVRSAVAGGFAGANPAFAGGSLMKGLSGGLTGGLKSDKEDTEAATEAEDTAQKQANFNRTQTDKEATSDALRKLYGQRGAALVTAADARASGAGKGAWNKPPHERYKDAMHLIQAERKAIYGQINPLAPKADQAAQRADADARLKAFTDKTLRTYGIDDNGNETSPTQGGRGTPSSPRSMGTQEGNQSGLYDTDAISGAREAIARGANPDQVKQRLKENGITFADEDLAL